MKDFLLKYAGSKPAPGDLLLPQAFINTAELESGRDDLATPAGLTRWLVDAGLLKRGAAATDSDVRQATAVREALRDLTLANNGAAADPNARETLNRAARSAQLAARFEADGGARLEPLAPGVDGALGTLLAIAFAAMASGTWSRLKACPADRCSWAFFDETKNRSGQWCTMSTCGNRTKARNYRKRHQAHAHT